MKWCVHFPEEEILIKRPSLRKACLGNRSAATFLSFLLYRASIHQEFQRSQCSKSNPSSERESQPTTQPATKPTTIGITITQQDIITQMDHEISDRSLRDTAIPLLLALDYLDVENTANATRYVVHLTKIQAGIDHPPTRAEILPRCQHLSDNGTFSAAYRNFFRRLAEEFPIEDGRISAIHRKFFHYAPEVFPVQSGNSSGATNRLQGACSQSRQPIFPDHKNKKSNKEKNTESNRKKEKEQEEQQLPEAEASQSSIAPTANDAATSTIFSSYDEYISHEDQANQMHQKDPKSLNQTSTETTYQTPDNQVPESQVPENQTPESQTPQTARSVDAVLHFIEEARGQRFLEAEHQQQAQAAALLLSLQPPFSLQDIQEAWHHGSDAYWRQHHDQRGMTLIDLAHHNKHGIRRIVATLEHKRWQQQTIQEQQKQQEQQGQRGLIRSHPTQRPTVQTQPTWQRATMTEQEAQQLVQRVEQDSQTHALHLHAICAYEHHSWVVTVQIGRHRLTIHSLSEWQHEFPGIQEVLQISKTAAPAGKDS
jgi:hypothetical protein